MKIVYDGVGDTLSIVLNNGQISHAEDYGPVIVNYDADNKPVEIEILVASRFLGDFISTLVKAKTGEKLIEVQA